LKRSPTDDGDKEQYSVFKTADDRRSQALSRPESTASKNG
jgi:hypothetical protein